MKCEAIQKAVLSLSPDLFASKPEYNEHIKDCEDCQTFVADIKQIRHGGAPGWLLRHLPKNYWSDLQEDVRSYVYYKGKRKQRRILRLLSSLSLVALGMVISSAFFLYKIKEERQLAHFSWQIFFQQLSADSQGLDEIAGERQLSETVKFLVTQYNANPIREEENNEATSETTN